MGEVLACGRIRKVPSPYSVADEELVKMPNTRTNEESLFPFRRTGSIILATSYSRKTFRQTTIGAAAFHFRVRDGNGWFHCAKVTRSGAGFCCAPGGHGGHLRRRDGV